MDINFTMELWNAKGRWRLNGDINISKIDIINIIQ